MAKTLTRAALYELVWTQPRTALAKEFGVSDVAIGKHCVQANIPAPPAGYWARLHAGRMVPRAPLPMRLPGQSDLVEIGASDRYGRWQIRANLDDALVPPVFAEDLDRQVGEALKRMGRVTATRDLHTPDPALSRVLAAEAKRRAKHEKDNWGWNKPYFDKPEHQRQLRIFNGFARALRPLYGRQQLGCEDEWVQGLGTLHHLVLNLDFGGALLELSFHEREKSRRRRERLDAATTLYLRSQSTGDLPVQWSDLPERRLEDQMTDIVTAVLRHAELAFRSNIQRIHEARIQRQEEERQAMEARRVEAERQRQAAIAAHKAKVRIDILEGARRMRQADNIRAMVDALRGHPEAGASAERLQAWLEHALELADELDPLKRPLDEVMGSFGTPRFE